MDRPRPVPMRAGHPNTPNNDLATIDSVVSRIVLHYPVFFLNEVAIGPAGNG